MSAPRSTVERAARRTGFGRDLGTYVLWQLPSWVVVVGLLASLNMAFELPRWVWLALPVLVAKDMLLFPAMRSVFRPPFLGRERLIGSRAHVIESLEPMGYVRLNGELWRAVAQRAGAVIQKGRPVVVRNVDGLTLIVDEEPVTVLRPLPNRVDDATLLRSLVPPTSPRERKQPRGSRARVGGGRRP